MPIYLVYFIQLLLVIHVLKTGRNRYWIWMLIMMPLIGGLTYLVIEILPELGGSIGGQRAMRQVRKAVNPGADLRRHEAAWKQSSNTDNARRYVRALIDGGQHDDAARVLDQALSGFFKTEANLLLLRAENQFVTGRAEDAVSTLDLLTEENPEFRSAEGHLLHARALEACGRLEDAIEQYRSVSQYFPGVEARFRLSTALALAGQAEAARRELEQLLNDAKLAPAHFRKSQKPWLDLARSELRNLPGSSGTELV